MKGYPSEARLPPDVPVSGVALADQVKCLDWRAGNAEIVCRLPDLVTAEVLSKLRTLLW